MVVTKFHRFPSLSRAGHLTYILFSHLNFYLHLARSLKLQRNPRNILFYTLILNEACGRHFFLTVILNEARGQHLFLPRHLEPSMRAAGVE